MADYNKRFSQKLKNLNQHSHIAHCHSVYLFFCNVLLLLCYNFIDTKRKTRWISRPYRL